MVASAKKIIAPASNVELFPSNYDPFTPAGKIAFTVIQRNHLSQHYATVLLTSPDFQKWIVLAVSTEHFECFKDLTKLGATDLVRFDGGCQALQAAVFSAMEACIAAPRNSMKSSFELALFKLQIDGGLQDIFENKFPSSLQKNHVFRCCILDYIAVTLHSNCIHFLKAHYAEERPQLHIALSTDERNMEVNRILGWAVSRLKHYYERKQ